MTATDEVRDRVAKMLRLAERAGTPAEAEAAMAKVQTYLERYNLSIASVKEHEESGIGAGRRTDEKHRGGFYAYERRVWEAVAELNFCLYFCYRRTEKRERPVTWNKTWRANNFRRVWEHQVVGRVHNVAATRAMATYLLQVVERLVRERLRTHEHWRVLPGQSENSQMRSRWAVSFREGAAESIVSRLEDRRAAAISEERARQRAAAERRAAGAAADTAVTLLTYVDAETDANNDYLYGEGWSARQAAQRAEHAAQRRQALEEAARWAAEHPEEAKKQEEERRKREERNARRRRGGYRGGYAEDKTDWSAWRAGREAGAAVGLDPQAEDARSRRAIA